MIRKIPIDTILMQIYYCDSNSSFNKLYNRLKWKPESIEGIARASYGISNGRYIGIVAVRKTHRGNIPAIVHEVNHLTEYMFEEFGFTDRHEHKSYLMEHITREILRSK